MRNVDEINELLRPLARVEPGQPGSRASGTGARALLASITAQGRGVGRTRRHGPRRLVLGVSAAVVLATGIVVGPSLLDDGRGGAASYANSAMEIRLEGDHYVARIKDPFAEHDKYTQAFRAVGLNVGLRPVPASPGGAGKILGTIIAAGGSSRPGQEAGSDRLSVVPLAMGTTPTGCRPGLDDHCVMVMRIPADFTGEVDVRLGRQAKPGEEYANFDSAMAPGEMFDGVKLREGRPVADILAEARARHLTVQFSLIRMDETTGGMSSFDPLPADQVGPGWTVWNAWQVKAGVIRLLVTPDRLPENPFYNGSAPPPAS
ncbi:hypothetical protein ACIBEJ_20425 [Nonomuraea sp. NPDC050790]|uniref:hypothetical protein n=1 Tax=Nonomuraea sp. NPDC050790 TaxID=3364371 RepID=UPI0037AC3D01